MLSSSEGKRTVKWVRVGGLLLLLIGLLGAVAYCFKYISQVAVTKVDPNQMDVVFPKNKKINILLLGSDERKNDIGRSNVTCLVTVATNDKTISMLWIPRDSRVNIPGYEWNKIGHAYAYKGTKLAEQTVANFIGIPVDYYLAVNVAGFSRIIDAMGGLEINVDKRMYYNDVYDIGEVDNNGLIDLKPGLQHMEGNTALQYIRFRSDLLGDISRIERQQKFVKAFLAAITNPYVIIKLPEIIKTAQEAVKTDLSFSQMFSLGKIAKEAYDKGLKTDMVQGKPVYIDEISYWLPDINVMRKQIAEIQGL